MYKIAKLANFVRIDSERLQALKTIFSSAAKELWNPHGKPVEVAEGRDRAGLAIRKQADGSFSVASSSNRTRPF